MFFIGSYISFIIESIVIIISCTILSIAYVKAEVLPEYKHNKAIYLAQIEKSQSKQISPSTTIKWFQAIETTTTVETENCAKISCFIYKKSKPILRFNNISSLRAPPFFR